jgi:small-conductance mechanosensitive channel
MRPSLFAVAVAAGLIAVILARITSFIAAPAARAFLARRARPAAEMIFAVSLLLASLLRLFDGVPGDTRVALAIIIGVLAWALRDVVVDVAAGWIVRMEGSVEAGRWIQLGSGVEGRVRRVGFQSCLIETAAGDQVRVRHRDFIEQPVTSADAAAGARAYTFTLEVPRSRPLAPLLVEIPAAALTSPWSSTARPPEVSVRAETGDNYIIDVTAWALDPTFAPEIEAAVRKALTP